MEPLTEEERLNLLMQLYFLERKLKTVPITELYDDPKWFMKKPGFIDFEPVIRPMMLYDPASRTIPQVFDVDALKVHDTDLDSRKEGEILLQNDALDLSGTPVSSTPFSTLGHQHLFCTMIIAAMATNPTGLTCTLEVSTDAFDTEIFTNLALDGVVMPQICLFADNAQFAFFMRTGAIAGAQTATNIPAFLPIPSIDAMVARLTFAVVGAGVTAELATLNVYGVTPR